MMSLRRASVHGIGVLTFVLVSALSSGCQSLEIRQSSNPYYEHDGMWCATYRISAAQARLAAIVALTKLQMPLYQEGPLRHGIFIDTRTPENFEVRIVIMPLGRYGEGTRVGVRVGGFGTHPEVCAGLLDELGRHLGEAPIVPVPPPPIAMPGPPSVTAAPQTQSRAAEPSLPPQPVPLDK